MKEEIRKKLIEKRKNLSEKEVFEKSKQIKKRLFKMSEFQDANTILFYISYDNEVYTHELIKDSISNKKKVVVPVTDKKNKELILSKLDSWDDLALGAYKILEPKKEKIKKISNNELDLIIVPGVGFDSHGNRIGHGKGYYDKLLKNSRAPTVGLAFEFQVVEKVPNEKHDVSIDTIVTEKRIIKSKK
jgi:5-formyltetrahydrofolate cyclo-ligase